VLGTFAFAIPTILMSGFATPVENMPYVLQLVAQADPLKHFLIIIQASFLKAPPMSVLWANAWPLVAIAAVTLSTAVLFPVAVTVGPDYRRPTVDAGSGWSKPPDAATVPAPELSRWWTIFSDP